MQKKSLLFMSAILLAVMYSCKKDPRACASADKTSALTGESVTFTNCSENALRILWEFGDGKSEEGNSVSHSYTNAGTYLVNMSAFSKKDKDWDKTSILIAVSDTPVAAKRYLTKMVLKTFATQNGSSDWDSGAELLSGTGPEPDVYVKLTSSAGGSVSTSTFSDAKTANTPILWLNMLFLSSNNWDITIYESDVLGSEEMNKWTINPATQPATNGVISLTATNYALDIYFEER